MFYLEVKIDKNNVNTSNFISNIIISQDSLGRKKDLDYFESDRLIKLGFIYNIDTQSFRIQRDFTINELKELTFEVSKLKYHTLIHGFTQLVIYENNLYFWDKSLIYKGIDTFEYCLKYHNTLKLEDLLLVTKSHTINEDLLNLVGYTRRYSTPTAEFVVQNSMWDKKEASKIFKDFITDENEYLLKNSAKYY